MLNEPVLPELPEAVRQGVRHDGAPVDWEGYNWQWLNVSYPEGGLDVEGKMHGIPGQVILLEQILSCGNTWRSSLSQNYWRFHGKTSSSCDTMLRHIKGMPCSTYCHLPWRDGSCYENPLLTTRHWRFNHLAACSFDSDIYLTNPNVKRTFVQYFEFIFNKESH